MTARFRRLSEERPTPSDRLVLVALGDCRPDPAVDSLLLFKRARDGYLQEESSHGHNRYWFYLDEVEPPKERFTPKEEAAASQFADFYQANTTLLSSEVEDAIDLVCRVGGFDKDRITRLIEAKYPELARRLTSRV